MNTSIRTSSTAPVEKPIAGGVTETLSGWTRWVGRQVVGRSDFRTKEEERTRDYVVLGAATGAVAGATIGVISGFRSQEANTIKEVWVQHNVVHPEMNGYSHHTTADYSTDCVQHDSEGNCSRTETELDGWWHSYSPNITDRVVGNYTEPTFQNTNTWEPLMGGALGFLGGGLIGMGAGLAVATLQKSINNDGGAPVEKPKLSPEAEKALQNRAGAAAVGGVLVGAALGSYVGSYAGAAELAAKQIHTRDWSVPVTETRTIGYVPRGHYEHNWFSGYWASPEDVNTRADQPVNRTVPVYNSNGDVRFAPTEQQFSTNRYGLAFGTIAGGVIGAGVGLAAGLAIGVSDKLLSEKPQ